MRAASAREGPAQDIRLRATLACARVMLRLCAVVALDEFCPSCATTLRWHVDIVPNRQVFAGGAFDDMRQFDVIAEMYTDEAVPGALLGCELSRPESADDAFRKLMVAKARSPRAK